MVRKKKLSNPFSTGGGGVHFEAHVQASFVALMLTGGHAPCLPCWPITEIKLQGKVDGFDTDDLIVIVKNSSNKERRKLLGQVKHSIAITQSCSLFGEVIQAAWNDFNNPKVFNKGKDIIALITGPLSATDEHNVQWLLNQAKHTKNVDEFFRNVQQANFSPSKCEEKLQVIRYHLKKAKDGNDVSRDELYNFMSCFYLLGYDLGREVGVVLSLLHSHISQFQQHYPKWVWSRIVDIVQTWNQDAGTIIRSKLPEDLLEAFKQKAMKEMPEELTSIQSKPRIDWAQHPNAIYLALAILIGAWNDKSKNDIKVITQFLGMGYDIWLQKSREILHCPDSPLSLNNGIWKVSNRAKLWSLLGSHILDQNLDSFQSMAVTVLKEPDPAFELPAENRYTASIHGKVLTHSNVLRKGIADGLAILGSNPDSCSNCSQGKVETTCLMVIREILTDANWVLWGSLNDVISTLAEAAPEEFLAVVEKALYQARCPFDELFLQEGKGIMGSNYLSGLLWALEGLAWDEQYLVRACSVLGEFAKIDPGGQYGNRPSNSLITILLPWLPQTLAPIEKRKVVVQTLLKELPDIAWDLILKLLPNRHQTSFGSHKPRWRMSIPDIKEKGVSSKEYWQQTNFYADLAVDVAGYDTIRLSQLISHFRSLPKSAFDKLLDVLGSERISELPEDQRLLLWDRLMKISIKHRRFIDSKWALSEELINRIENVALIIAPADPFNQYKCLFTDRDYDLYDKNGDWEEQRKKLNERREAAVIEIYQNSGIDGIIRFAESVVSSRQVGQALSFIKDELIEHTFLPEYLDTLDKKHKALVSGFLWERHYISGWEWCDNIDKSEWSPVQKGHFLTYMPFTQNAWDRASEWLPENQEEYWSRTGVNVYQAEGDLAIAIEKLIQYNRPHAAISCLESMREASQPINVDQCIGALIEALSSTEPAYTINGYHITELITFLQSEPSVDQGDLLKIEWAYLPLLDGYSGAVPKLLMRKLASAPEFFCEVIQLIYRSNRDSYKSKEPKEESRELAVNAMKLLRKWETPPGFKEDGHLDIELFSEWLQRVTCLCTKSGHLEVALIHIGKVLIYSPPDPEGLWIHQAIASALNDRAAEDMRTGFYTGTLNSRGVHEVDPTGKPEKELAEHFRRKAEDVENFGYQRFAVTLKRLAESYDQDSKKIQNEYGEQDED